MPTQPPNWEFPFSELNSFITPTDQFYVRCHYPVPRIEPREWKLSVSGALERPFDLSLPELLAAPSRTLAATLECAGNSRVFLDPPAKGVQWGCGAVSTAEWTGVPLALLLEGAGVSASAVEVIFEGADAGEIDDHPAPPGQVPFTFSIPIERAMQPDVLLVFAMNGSPLTPAHGFPVRAIVPGYYAMASVKWLTRVIVTCRPFTGYYQTIDYAAWEDEDGIAVRRPLRDMRVKSLIARPVPGETIAAASRCMVKGAAWSGHADVAKVEVSWDGEIWIEARLLGELVRSAWRLWECECCAPSEPGRHQVMSRATDSCGRVQPLAHDPSNCNYVIHHVIPIAVEIVSRASGLESPSPVCAKGLSGNNCVNFWAEDCSSSRHETCLS